MVSAAARKLHCKPKTEGDIMQEVDARGLSCPEPALMAIDAIEEFPNEPIRVLVSSATQKVNISEAAAKKGRRATSSREGDDFAIVIE